MIIGKHVYGHNNELFFDIGEQSIRHRDKFCFIPCPPDRCDCMPNVMDYKLSGEIEYEKMDGKISKSG